MHKRSFGWIARKIHNKIKYLKVLTYEQELNLIGGLYLKISYPLPRCQSKSSNAALLRPDFDTYKYI